MKILVDLNVLLDVLQRRAPFYDLSAQVLSRIVRRQVGGCLPGHALTTLHYIVAREGRSDEANQFIDWVLERFEVIGEDRAVFVRARGLPMTDFDDAVVASVAERAHCDFIVTRNPADFVESPVPAVTPEEWLDEVS